MKKESINIGIFSDMEEIITTVEKNKADYCTHPRAFSRSTRLSFRRCLCFLLNSIRKSLSVELVDYFDHLGELEEVCSKSAWVQARQQILSKVLVEMNAHLCHRFDDYAWSDTNGISGCWEGFDLRGVDGSTLYLPNTTALRQRYGVQANGQKEVPMARIVVNYDLRSGLCRQSYLGGIDQGEEVPLPQWLSQSHSRQLFIYDRGFPSYHLFFLHTRAGSHFLARMPRTFGAVRDFIQSGDQQTIVPFCLPAKSRADYSRKGVELPKDFSISLRLIRVELPGGQIEVLATTLLDTLAYPAEEFADLYFLRWKVEGYYDRLKHQLNLELFSGHLPIVIEQDFFAAILLSNLQQCLVLLAQQSRDTPKGENAAQTTYQYQINYNVALGIMKHRLVKSFLIQEGETLRLTIIQLIASHLEPVRPNRALPRDRRSKKFKGKHQYDQNYKQAV